MQTRATTKRVVEEQPSCSTSKKLHLKRAKNQMSILELNDDCLDHICKKLCFKDQMGFASTCLRFKSIFQIYCKPYENKTVFVLSQIKSLTAAEREIYLEVLGPFIKQWDKVEDNEEHQQALTLVSRYCPNLKTITLFRGDVTSRNMISFLEHKRSITEVRFHNCDRIKSGIIFAIQQLPKFETLRVLEGFPVHHIPTLKQLQQLTLVGVEMRAREFINIFKTLLELKSLNVLNCTGLTAEAYNVMVANLKKLEILKISIIARNDIPYERVALLPNLKRLELLIWPRCPRTPLIFKALVEHKADQLEYLRIFPTKYILTYQDALQISRITQLKCLNLKLINLNFDNTIFVESECFPVLSNLENLEVIVFKNCLELTNEAMLQILRKCTKIKIVCLWGCDKITTEFVEQAIEVLRQRENPSTQVVHFHFNLKAITDSIYENPEVLTAKSLVKISLKAYDDNDDQDNYIKDSKYSNSLDYFEENYDEESNENNYPSVYKIWAYYSRQPYCSF